MDIFTKYLVDEEEFKVSQLINKCAKELEYMGNVIENIPYYQIAPTSYIKKQSNLYELEYYSYFGFQWSNRCIYLFSKEVLEKVKISMDALNKRIRGIIKKKVLNEVTLEYVSEEKLNELINRIGYTELKEKAVSDRINKYFLIKKPIKKRVMREVDCTFCGDGGCIHCEPYRFI